MRENINDTQFMIEAINAKVMNEVNSAINAEIAKAVESIAKAIRSKADEIALSIVAQYRVESRGAEIVIRVNKEV